MKRQLEKDYYFKKMIKIILELSLIYPYNISLFTLIEFCFLWDSIILYGGTKKIKAIISVPYSHFKKIFNKNPVVGKINVPDVLNKFVDNIVVLKILTI